jgi:hypothetical protein
LTAALAGVKLRKADVRLHVPTRSLCLSTALLNTPFTPLPPFPFSQPAAAAQPKSAAAADQDEVGVLHLKKKAKRVLSSLAPCHVDPPCPPQDLVRKLQKRKERASEIEIRAEDPPAPAPTPVATDASQPADAHDARAPPGRPIKTKVGCLSQQCGIYSPPHSSHTPSFSSPPTTGAATRCTPQHGRRYEKACAG